MPYAASRMRSWSRPRVRRRGNDRRADRAPLPRTRPRPAERPTAGVWALPAEPPCKPEACRQAGGNQRTARPAGRAACRWPRSAAGSANSGRWRWGSPGREVPRRRPGSSSRRRGSVDLGAIEILVGQFAGGRARIAKLRPRRRSPRSGINAARASNAARPARAKAGRICSGGRAGHDDSNTERG